MHHIFRINHQKVQTQIIRVLSNIPTIEFNSIFKIRSENMDFIYGETNIIPKYGCYTIIFNHKLSAKEFCYDSRENKFQWTHVTAINPEKIEISISFDEVRIIINALDDYFLENKHYPDKLDLLIPKYLKNFPFKMVAKYYKSNIVNYNSYKPEKILEGVIFYILKLIGGNMSILEKRNGIIMINLFCSAPTASMSSLVITCYALRGHSEYRTSHTGGS